MRRAAVAVAVLATGSAAVAQAAPTSRWEISAGARAGVPSGWVQVRENSVAGTRLDLRGALNVRAIWAADLELDYRPDPRTRISLAVTSVSLTGTTTLPQAVYFNGATLAAGSVLATRTELPSFIAATITGTRRISTLWGGELGASAGLTFVGLTFVLHGTLAPGSATHETQEDFVTQELPAPLLGLDYARALGARFSLRMRLTGAYLPWVNSLRNEGGVVTIAQTGAQLETGVAYALTTSLRLTAEFRLSSFAQHEQSTEDGNDIALRAATLGLGVAARF